MRIVNGHSAIKARTVPPHHHGYLLLAAEVDWRGPFRRPSPAKRKLLADAKARSVALTERDGVIEATLFRAALIAPGEGIELIKARAGKVHHARYDVVILIRTTSVEAARELRKDPEYAALADNVRKTARYTMEVVATNVVRLGEVDHRPNHVFLFNYFYADDKAELLPVFEYTAGWFQANTGLLNSILLQPLEGNRRTTGSSTTRAGLVSKRSCPVCSSDRPSVGSCWTNFAANNVAAQPILYRRV